MDTRSYDEDLAFFNWMLDEFFESDGSGGHILPEKAELHTPSKESLKRLEDAMRAARGVESDV